MPSSSYDSQNSAKQHSQAQTCQISLLDWATWIVGQDGQSPALHHRFLLQHLDGVSRGEIHRLMVLMPPGSAKSTYGSLIFPAWWFGAHPSSSVIATTHTMSLAEHFGRQVREIAREYGELLGYRLQSGQQAAGHWRTSQKGDYFAAGIRGPLVGRRADLVIIDDPIKSQNEADSPLMRERLWSWYRFDLTTRLKPHGRIVLIMTRWHEDDLAGRLLGQNAAEWLVIRLPALAEEDDPLQRQPGSALWPEWEDENALARRREVSGERGWSALFQQDPRPATGNLFKTGCIDILDAAPGTFGTVVRAWDLANTAPTGTSNPDWTVGVKLARDERGRFIVLDVARMRGSPHDLEELIVETARIDGRAVTICLPQDPGQAGKHQVSYIARLLGGFRISSSPETGAKTTRAMPMASQIEAHNVAIVRGHWNHAFLDELASFPFGSKDDQVDALSRAFKEIFELGVSARHLTLPFLAR